jgi:hypothetical protein
MHQKTYHHSRVDTQFERFYKRHFEDPRECRNVEQVRFYLGEISRKIEEYRRSYNYVPEKALNLWESYKKIYNRMVHSDINK